MTGQGRGLKVWFVDDVRAILGTVAEANRDVPRHPDFYIALRAVAVGFGLEVPPLPIGAQVGDALGVDGQTAAVALLVQAGVIRVGSE